MIRSAAACCVLEVFCWCCAYPNALSPFPLQRPTLSATEIVFSYAGDLWSMALGGREARQLTSGPGNKTDPVFSPDGRTIAFTSDSSGNDDVYIVPASGGSPQRLTYHPAGSRAVAWSPDGNRVIFASSRTSPNYGCAKLFAVSRDGGFPAELPFPMASEAAFAADGLRVAYDPIRQTQPGWKHYRGGQARRIWIGSIATSETFAIPRANSDDFNPMWVGNRVYFLSDRDGPVTVFYYDTVAKTVAEVFRNNGNDVLSAAAIPGVLVYEQLGSLWTINLRTGARTSVEVSITSHDPQAQPYSLNVAKQLRDPDLSVSGAGAVFEARGDIIAVPLEKGSARNLTHSSSSNARYPAWSPDGKSIAYLSDEAGEYELIVQDQGTTGPPLRLQIGNDAFFYGLQWSPDSRRIAFADSHQNLWYVDLQDPTPILVDKDLNSLERDWSFSWSPDSHWIAYRRHLASRMGVICLYSLADGKRDTITDGMSDAGNPAFDKGGNYLYFTVSTNDGPARQPDMFSRVDPIARSIYVVILKRGLKSPFAAVSNDKVSPSDSITENGAKLVQEDSSSRGQESQIEIAGIQDRILALTLPAKRYEVLLTGRPGVLYAIEFDDPHSKAGTLYQYDVKTQKLDSVVHGAADVRISFDGEKLLYRRGDEWIVTEPSAHRDGTDEDGQGQILNTRDISVYVTPQDEWRQMYHEAFLIQRDFLFTARDRSVDLRVAEDHYRPYLDRVTTRNDLNYLLREAFTSVSSSHVMIGGPSADKSPSNVGLLGADYQIEHGRYRFSKIFTGERWNPRLRNPLLQPGDGISRGDYLLSVDGQILRGTDNIYSFFENTVGREVSLEVSATPDGAGSRIVRVVPISAKAEFVLRHWTWVEDNRTHVDLVSNGRVGYVHLPDTGTSGYQSFIQYFFAQVDKQAIVVDARFNSGGQLPSDIIEYLLRPQMLTIAPRDGTAWRLPYGAVFGPKVLLTNEYTASGGDVLAWLFKSRSVGTVVGTRTWGGVTVLTDTPDLKDGGFVTAPTAIILDPSGNTSVENRGVDPDIQVELNPSEVRKGIDPQLDRAVQTVLAKLSNTTSRQSHTSRMQRACEMTAQPSPHQRGSHD